MRRRTLAHPWRASNAPAPLQGGGVSLPTVPDGLAPLARPLRTTARRMGPGHAARPGGALRRRTQAAHSGDALRRRTQGAASGAILHRIRLNPRLRARFCS
jgi:hypothetical protein